MAKKDGKNKVQSPQIRNKKARFNYEFVEKVEAGLVLKGSEVKSLRAGQADLEGAYARLINDECWLVGAKISQYEQATYNNHDPMRKRKLLLHKNQIKKIKARLTQKGFTLVPLQIYFNDRGLAKITLAVATGKRQFDKRSTIKERQQKLDAARAVRNHNK